MGRQGVPSRAAGIGTDSNVRRRSWPGEQPSQPACAVARPAHLWAMAGVPSSLSGRNSCQTPKSFLVAQCSGPAFHPLYSPIRATACGEVQGGLAWALGLEQRIRR